jgi:predicted acetyltransferase
MAAKLSPTMTLREFKREGLASVELTSNADNIASRLVIEAKGSKLIQQFDKLAEDRGAASLRFGIDLVKHSEE